jgi:rare lipoprotein A
MNIKKLKLLVILLLVIVGGCAQPWSDQENNFDGDDSSPILSGRRGESSPTKPAPSNSAEAVISTENGKASYYSDQLHGKATASGELYDRNKLTAAHKKLAFGTICRVTNLANGKSVKVRINDRGPFTKNRIIDLSYKAAADLDGIRTGIMDVKVEVLESKAK